MGGGPKIVVPKPPPPTPEEVRRGRIADLINEKLIEEQFGQKVITDPETGELSLEAVPEEPETTEEIATREKNEAESQTKAA